MTKAYIIDSWRALYRRRRDYVIFVVTLTLLVISFLLVINLQIGIDQYLKQDNQSQPDTFSLISGNVVDRQSGTIFNNFFQTIGMETNLTDADWQLVDNHPDVELASPVINLNWQIERPGENINSHVLVVNQYYLSFIPQAIEYGSNVLGSNNNTVVIGDLLAQELFGDSRPISQEIIINGDSFIVAGVLEAKDNLNVFSLDFDYRQTVFIPYSTFQASAQQTNGIHRIIIRFKADAIAGIDNIEELVLDNHQGQADFTVFKGSQLLVFTADGVRFLTFVVIVIYIMIVWASIFPIYASIGLFSSKRYSEISLRRILGASNLQITLQLILEVVILSCLAVVLGLIGGVLVSFILESIVGLPMTLAWGNLGIYLNLATIIVLLALGISLIRAIIQTLKNSEESLI